MENDKDILRALLWAAGRELNSINARDGAPEGVHQEWFDDLIDAIRHALGGDIAPWPPDKSTASAIERLFGQR